MIPIDVATSAPLPVAAKRPVPIENEPARTPLSSVTAPAAPESPTPPPVKWTWLVAVGAVATVVAIALQAASGPDNPAAVAAVAPPPAASIETPSGAPQNVTYVDVPAGTPVGPGQGVIEVHTRGGLQVEDRRTSRAATSRRSASRSTRVRTRWRSRRAAARRVNRPPGRGARRAIDAHRLARALMGRAARRALLALFALAACSRDAPDRAATSAPAATTPTATAGTSDAPPAAPVVAIDALAGDGACVFENRGVLLDLGDASSKSAMASADRDGRVEPFERDGATWARVLARGVTMSFLATPDDVAAATADSCQRRSSRRASAAAPRSRSRSS